MKDNNLNLKIRQVIKQQVFDGISPESIVFSVGRIVTPDEAKYLNDYAKKYKLSLKNN